MWLLDRRSAAGPRERIHLFRLRFLRCRVGDGRLERRREALETVQVDGGTSDHEEIGRDLTDHLVERQRDPVREPAHHVGVGDSGSFAREL